VEDVLAKTHSTSKTINETFWNPGYETVVLIERHVPFYKRISFYTIAEGVVVTIVIEDAYQQIDS